MKKVLFTATVDSHIIHFHLPYLKYFKDNGYEVHVSTNGMETIPYCDKKYIIPYDRNPYKLNNLKAIKQLKAIIDKEHYDIIHTHTPIASAVTRIAALKARKNGTKVLYTAHGFHFYKGAPLINWLIFYPIEKILSKYTDYLITINKEDYHLALTKFKNTKVEYIKGVGVDPNKFNFKMTKQEKHELRKSFGLKDTDYVLIYSAELNENKNQDMLIKSMQIINKNNPRIHLLLAGIDSYNGKYQDQVKSLGLESNIHFIGYRKDIPKILKISNLAVSASKREGLGLNIVEALINGLPVIATNNRGHRDLIKDGINGYLVEIDDYITMANKIKEISKKNSTNKYDASKFLIDKSLNKVKKLYNK